MKYQNNINYQQKIQKAISEYEEKEIRLNAELRELEYIGNALRNIGIYALKKIMPVLAKMVSEMENTEFKWGIEQHLLKHPYGADGSLVDIVYLINAKSNLKRFAIEGEKWKCDDPRLELDR